MLAPVVSIPGQTQGCGNDFHIATRRHVQDTCPKCPADSIGRPWQLWPAGRVGVAVCQGVGGGCSVEYVVISICTANIMHGSGLEFVGA